MTKYEQILDESTEAIERLLQQHVYRASTTVGKIGVSSNLAMQIGLWTLAHMLGQEKVKEAFVKFTEIFKRHSSLITLYSLLKEVAASARELLTSTNDYSLDEVASARSEIKEAFGEILDTFSDTTVASSAFGLMWAAVWLNAYYVNMGLKDERRKDGGA